VGVLYADCDLRRQPLPFGCRNNALESLAAVLSKEDGLRSEIFVVGLTYGMEIILDVSFGTEMR
jgi:hypothetical protein